MFKKNDLPEEPQPEYREECYICHRPKQMCLCDSIKQFSTNMRFVILMHDKEAKDQRTGTGRLAHLCLENSELLVGVDFTENKRVNELIKDPAYVPYVLYPGPSAVNFSMLEQNGFTAGKTILIFVIDGTWRTAKSIINKSKNIQLLPRISFSGSYISQFKIKKQPKDYCVSTIEAIYYLCREAESAGYEKLSGSETALMTVFKKMVDIQLSYSSRFHKRREDNKKKTDKRDPA